MALKIKCSSSEKLPHQVLCGVRSSQVAERLGKAAKEGKQSRQSSFFFISLSNERVPSPLRSALVPWTEEGRETGWNVAQMLFSAMGGGGRRKVTDGEGRLKLRLRSATATV